MAKARHSKKSSSISRRQEDGSVRLIAQQSPGWIAGSGRSVFAGGTDQIGAVVTKLPGGRVSMYVAPIGFESGSVLSESPAMAFDGDKLEVDALWWQATRTMSISVNGQPIGELSLSRMYRGLLGVWVGPGQPSFTYRSDLLQSVRQILGFFTALEFAGDFDSFSAALLAQPDRQRFELESAILGSLALKLAGPARAIKIAARYLRDFLAIWYGKGERLAEAHVGLLESEKKTKDADARLKNATAGKIEQQELTLLIRNSAELQTLNGKMLADMKKRFPNASPEEHQKEIDRFLYGPSIRIAEGGAKEALRVDVIEVDTAPVLEPIPEKSKAKKSLDSAVSKRAPAKKRLKKK